MALGSRIDAVHAAAGRALAAGEPAVCVSVSAARGSVPREPGCRMLVTAHAIAGSVGGGHLELKAIERARAMLAAGERMPIAQTIPLGPALGQCCGGVVSLAYAPLDAALLAAWPQSAPRFHLQLYGAGHVGRAIANALAPLDVRVDWIDEREAEFPPALGGEAWPPHIARVCVDAVEAEVATAPTGAFAVIATHRHDLDLSIAAAALARGDFGFVGVIGSATKRARFAHRLETMGFAAAAIRRLVCPIGLDGIVGKDPAVIAASVVAQLLQVSSGPLRVGAPAASCHDERVPAA
ncbi:xanthine dehydrogenase accessory protein XdhC [Piscinibacter koreensis]|uniref:Xanthine dehydrogenase accessory protein XdhC n=1 Tax=Piscinibacter koreensis TaxID=2742824 RepID=A0A7Y6NPM4_9BURK|nr:xanthine dehydrogenase accessory protein XdhC [Schlegelella koreensis]NUZ06899.1 xanthine dehydrogenase accessory protein XdhC [Schlegelella koreensis]